MQDKFTKQPIIVMAAPIMNEAGQIIAVLAGAIKIAGNDFFGEVVSRKLRVGGDIHIISPKDDVVVTSTDSRLILKTLPPRGATK